MVRKRVSQNRSGGVLLGLSCVTALFGTLALLGISVPLLEAADVKEHGRQIAFVVGIGAYKNFPPIPNALHDADAVRSKLREIGFNDVGPPIKDLKRSEFYTHWQNVLDGLTEEDTFVFYFSGHGVQIERENYLLPADMPYIQFGRQIQITAESIRLNDLLSDLSSSSRRHPKRAIVILDACRDNPLIPDEFKKGVVAGGLASMSRTDGVFIIYSAASDSVAWARLSPSDSSKYSVFTRVLLPLLDRSDLGIRELSLELKRQVSRLANSANLDQMPEYFDGFHPDNMFCFPGCNMARVPIPAPPVLPQEIRVIWTPVLKNYFIISQTGLYLKPDQASARLSTIQQGFKVYAESKMEGGNWLQVRVRDEHGYIPLAAATQDPPWEVLPWREGDSRGQNGRHFGGDDMKTVQEQAMQFALEYAKRGEKITWRSEPGWWASGFEGYFKVRHTDNEGDIYCREFDEYVDDIVAGRTRLRKHSACRDSSGVWHKR